ncbi:ADP-ribosylglycohydrolase family protein [Flavobacterium sediminilitoris]|uniref:ADP-ribosylglycohydrolase family protein n=1 Tax=Flavobacterium sediminilitoris TaxID=2024526 RepID=A0ABY4HQ23_9FLAO|nr:MULTISPECIES: ADP-ribosylglycohydrolase family protein [Flavobacterium]UOX34780.1 ADP-ribosylglycohydrolase family protein [Flavobacterium sediminilitoris]
MKINQVHSALFGVAVGDALGVPVEFQDRELLARFPVVNMRENGSHAQPRGTWSDDSSLTFCLAESLCIDYDLEDIASKFKKWYNSEIWTPHGRVFDIGIATREAIYRISTGHKPELCGGFDVEDNGNGSLMRILPLAFYLKEEKDINIIYQKVKEVSSITHAHFRSVFACFIYVVYALEILKGHDKFEAYNQTKIIVEDFIANKDFNKKEIQLFDRILKVNVNELEKDKVYSSGYVLHSLEASLWCLLKSNTYEETVLKAVNLGGDTDTTAAIAGGLAGLLYGYENIPEEWINVLARKNDITKLCDTLSKKYEIHN